MSHSQADHSVFTGPVSGYLIDSMFYHSDHMDHSAKNVIPANGGNIVISLSY